MSVIGDFGKHRLGNVQIIVDIQLEFIGTQEQRLTFLKEIR